MTVFGNRLRSLLEEKELEGKDFAKILQVNPSTISNWMNEKRSPSNDMLVTIADFFGVSVDYLLGRTNERNGKAMTGNENDLGKMLEEMGIRGIARGNKDMTPEDKAKFLEMMKLFFPNAFEYKETNGKK